MIDPWHIFMELADALDVEASSENEPKAAEATRACADAIRMLVDLKRGTRSRLAVHLAGLQSRGSSPDVIAAIAKLLPDVLAALG